MTLIVGVQGPKDEEKSGKAEANPLSSAITKGVYLLDHISFRKLSSGSSQGSGSADILFDYTILDEGGKEADKFRTPLSAKPLTSTGPWIVTTRMGLHILNTDNRTQRLMLPFEDITAKLIAQLSAADSEYKASLEEVINTNLPKFKAEKGKIAFVTPYSPGEFLLTMLVGYESYEAHLRPSPCFFYEAAALLHLKPNQEYTAFDITLLNTDSTGYIKKRDFNGKPLLYVPSRGTLLVKNLLPPTSLNPRVTMRDAMHSYTFSDTASTIISFDVTDNYVGAIVENPETGAYSLKILRKEGTQVLSLDTESITMPPKTLRIEEKDSMLYCYVGCYGGTITTAVYDIDKGVVSKEPLTFTRNCFMKHDDIYDKRDDEDNKYSVKRISIDGSGRLLFCFANQLYMVPRQFLADNNITHIEQVKDLTDAKIVSASLPHRITIFYEGGRI